MTETHEAIEELLVGYVLRSLSGEDAARADHLLSDHVPHCPAVPGFARRLPGRVGRPGLRSDAPHTAGHPAAEPARVIWASRSPPPPGRDLRGRGERRGGCGIAGLAVCQGSGSNDTQHGSTTAALRSLRSPRPCLQVPRRVRTRDRTDHRDLRPRHGAFYLVGTMCRRRPPARSIGSGWSRGRATTRRISFRSRGMWSFALASTRAIRPAS